MGNVLLVEDDFLDIMSVQRTFKKAGVHHNLIVAKNGVEALEMLRGEGTEKIDPKPLVILLDINMPKMNGIEFLQAIRNDSQFRDIEVFMTTTSEEEQDQEAARRLNVRGYIVKPLSFESFEKASSSMDSFSLFMKLMK
jgi:CheY-like chemotaxis protein